MQEGRFHCFTRIQQRTFRTGGRVTNRSWTDWQPTGKLQVELKRKSMSEAEVSEVRKLTGHSPYLEEKFV